MSAPYIDRRRTERASIALADAKAQATQNTLDSFLRVITKRYGGLLGPVYTVATDGKYFEVGELTLQQLKRGIPAGELDLMEIDPDEERWEY